MWLIGQRDEGVPRGPGVRPTIQGEALPAFRVRYSLGEPGCRRRDAAESGNPATVQFFTHPGEPPVAPPAIVL